jgi:hypothetical protein
MSQKQRDELYQNIVRQNNLTAEIDDESQLWLKRNASIQNSDALLPRHEFIMMPGHVAHEILQAVLRRKVGKSATRPLADRALLFTKVAKAHKTFPIDRNWQLRALPRKVIVERRVDMVSLDNAKVRVDQTLNEDNAT